MKVDVLTIFPAIVQAGLDESILRIARENGLLDAEVHDPREFTWDTHRSVDDRPYGGGPGMVMKPEPLVLCAEKVFEQRGRGRVVVMSPSGRRFTQDVAREYAGEEHLVLLCGRYEGIDQRVVDILGAEELSIGDFVLSGGEVASLAVIEAVTRLLPGALGHDEATVEESFEDGLLEYPQYTRPPEWREHRVPDILLSGDHARIAAWRRERSEERTRRRQDEKDAPHREADGGEEE
ncbi:MAG: tRNA (guanosine(37)-N1)-methyltransferase TrmD [Planctomycetota bacterium]